MNCIKIGFKYLEMQRYRNGEFTLQIFRRTLQRRYKRFKIEFKKVDVGREIITLFCFNFQRTRNGVKCQSAEKENDTVNTKIVRERMEGDEINR